MRASGGGSDPRQGVRSETMPGAARRRSPVGRRVPRGRAFTSSISRDRQRIASALMSGGPHHFVRRVGTAVEGESFPVIAPSRRSAVHGGQTSASPTASFEARPIASGHSGPAVAPIRSGPARATDHEEHVDPHGSTGKCRQSSVEENDRQHGNSPESVNFPPVLHGLADRSGGDFVAVPGATGSGQSARAPSGRAAGATCALARCAQISPWPSSAH